MQKRIEEETKCYADRITAKSTQISVCMDGSPHYRIKMANVYTYIGTGLGYHDSVVC